MVQVFNILRDKGSMAFLLAALLFSGFIAFLIGANYVSQREVQRFLLTDLNWSLERKNSAISNFFIERRNDLKELAARSEVEAFFENKALGMTMEYGLKACLVLVSEVFGKFGEDRLLDGRMVYTRVTLLDSSGASVVDWPAGHRESAVGAALKEYVNSGAAEPQIVVESATGSSEAVISMPCFSRGNFAGAILAWLPLQTVYDHFVRQQSGARAVGEFLYCERNGSARPLSLNYQESPFDGCRKELETNGRLFPAKKDRIAGINTHPVRVSGYESPLLVMRASIPGTPFVLVHLQPESDLFGKMRPWHLLVALGALAVFLLGGVSHLWRINLKNMVLKARLEESSRREQAVEAINRELRIEIGEREKAERRYRDLFDNISDGIYTHDLEGRFISVNPAVSKVLGPEKEVVGHALAEFMLPEHRDFFYREYLPRIRDKGFFRGTFLLMSSNGEGHFIECRNSLVQEAGEAVYIRGSGRDITEHIRQEEALQRAKDAAVAANRAKSDFLANMNHELRTPLNAIIGFTDLVLDRQCGDLNPTQEDYLDEVLKSARHLLVLINDIFDLTRVETGKLELHVSEICLPDLLARSTAILKEKAVQHGIRLAMHFDGIPETIVADERKLKQILYNLLANAIKFTPDGGEVWLRAEMAGECVQISVKDNGIGVDKRNLERIFNPFEQADASLSREHRGSGLGLPLAKSMVELHGGRIWAESAGKDRGATFLFTIPYNMPGGSKGI